MLWAVLFGLRRGGVPEVSDQGVFLACEVGVCVMVGGIFFRVGSWHAVVDERL